MMTNLAPVACTLGTMSGFLLSRLLTATPVGSRSLAQAVAADPALSGRARCDAAGGVILTGAGGGPPPASRKEREVWELHVRLRVAGELGENAASELTIRWGASGDSI